MKILATFANREYDPTVVELVHAWDENSVDENYTGYKETLKAALDSWGDDLLRWVTIEIEVPDGPIDAILNPQITMRATVSVPDGTVTG